MKWFQHSAPTETKVIIHSDTNAVYIDNLSGAVVLKIVKRRAIE